MIKNDICSHFLFNNSGQNLKALHGSPQKNRVIACHCTNDKRKGTKLIFVIKEEKRPTHTINFKINESVVQGLIIINYG